MNFLRKLFGFPDEAGVKAVIENIPVRTISILLLGPSESGKSTFMKQMRIIYGSGYDSNARDSHKLTIIKNILESVQQLIRAMDSLKILYLENLVKAKAEFILNLNILDLSLDQLANAEIWDSIEMIWKDSGVQNCYRRRSEYNLMDNTDYYLDDIRRFQDRDYLPTVQDILNSRVKTTGVHEYQFTCEEILYRVIDVGGQRVERGGWLRCFDSITSVIFLAAISEYDQMLTECPDRNRLTESVNLFRVLIANPWFVRSSFILFMNKIDILADKVQFSDIDAFFSEFEGSRKDAESAKTFFFKMFEDARPNKARPFYSHFTCATDTENIRFVFAAARDTILRENLNRINLM